VFYIERVPSFPWQRSILLRHLPDAQCSLGVILAFCYLLFRESISINPTLRLVKGLFLVMAIPLTTLTGIGKRGSMDFLTCHVDHSLKSVASSYSMFERSSSQPVRSLARDF
jgi:hypothetical protein